MAIGDPYATLSDIKGYLSIPLSNTEWDAALNSALSSASRDVEKHCHRQFNLDSVLSQRIFAPDTTVDCRVDDFGDLTGLVVEYDSSGNGDFATLGSTNYEVLPLNGVSDGVPGWPFNRLRATSGPWFYRYPYGRTGTVRVTAKWGWPAVPSPIHQATLIIASQKFKLAEAPWGVAGMTEYGTAVRIREIPLVKETLCPYIRYPVLGG